MIIKITNPDGQTAYIENEGQVNGEVKIQGDSSLVSHLNHIINLDVDLPFGGLRDTVDSKFTTTSNGLVVLYKASNVYLKEHFIPVECPIFDYVTEILKE